MYFLGRLRYSYVRERTEVLLIKLKEILEKLEISANFEFKHTHLAAEFTKNLGCYIYPL